MSQEKVKSRQDLIKPSKSPSIFVGVPYSDPIIIGREALLAQKVEALVRGKDNNLSIVGGLGIGKTSFASAIAQHPRVVKRFKDGILWVNLGRNSDPSITIARWAKLLGIDLVRNATFENRVRAIKQVICAGEFLTILDDVKDLEIAYSLGIGVSRCRVIVISEIPTIGKTFTGRRYCIELSGLDSDTSIQLVNSMNPNVIGMPIGQFAELVNACQGNPLLLLRAAAYLNLFQEIGDKNHSLGKATPLSFSEFINKIQYYPGEKQKLYFVTQSILNLLPSRFVTSFYGFGAFAPEPQLFDRNAAMAVCGFDSDEIQKLIDLRLLLAEGNSLWLTNDIAELIQEQTPSRAIECHRKYYRALLISYQNNHECVESIYGQIKWFSKSSTYDELEPPLFGILADYLEDNGLWQDYLEIGEKAIQDAEWITQNDRVANICNRLARVHSILNHKEKALEYYQLALNLTNPIERKSERAQILNNLGTIYANLSGNEKAAHCLREARILIDGMSNPIIESNVLNNLGKVEFDLGHYDQSIEILKQAAKLIPTVDDVQLIINIHFNLAKALYTKGDLNESVIQLRQVVEIEKKVANPDLDQDMKLLFEMEHELAMPRIVRWIRRKITSLEK